MARGVDVLGMTRPVAVSAVLSVATYGWDPARESSMKIVLLIVLVIAIIFLARMVLGKR